MTTCSITFALFSITFFNFVFLFFDHFFTFVNHCFHFFHHMFHILCSNHFCSLLLSLFSITFFTVFDHFFRVFDHFFSCSTFFDQCFQSFFHHCYGFFRSRYRSLFLSDLFQLIFYHFFIFSITFFPIIFFAFSITFFNHCFFWFFRSLFSITFLDHFVGSPHTPLGAILKLETYCCTVLPSHVRLFVFAHCFFESLCSITFPLFLWITCFGFFSITFFNHVLQFFCLIIFLTVFNRFSSITPHFPGRNF